MTKKCACGSDKLQEVKMGGSSVSLVATDKLVFYGYKRNLLLDL